MMNTLISTFKKERNQAPQSINELLDYFQRKYIIGEITINDYRQIFACLHKEGAVSAYEDTELKKS